MASPFGVARGRRREARDRPRHAQENRVHVHVLHATILHLMGLNHEKLTYHCSGRDFRLTDVYGSGVKEVLA